LSPLDSFSSELGTKFEVVLEGKQHCVPQSQVFLGVLGAAPDNVTALNSTHKSADTTEYQDAIGRSILEYAKVLNE
jgi:hypothetical protein